MISAVYSLPFVLRMSRMLSYLTIIRECDSWLSPVSFRRKFRQFPTTNICRSSAFSSPPFASIYHFYSYAFSFKTLISIFFFIIFFFNMLFVHTQLSIAMSTQNQFLLRISYQFFFYTEIYLFFVLAHSTRSDISRNASSNALHAISTMSRPYN